MSDYAPPPPLPPTAPPPEAPPPLPPDYAASQGSQPQHCACWKWGCLIAIVVIGITGLCCAGCIAWFNRMFESPQAAAEGFFIGVRDGDPDAIARHSSRDATHGAELADEVALHVGRLSGFKPRFLDKNVHVYGSTGDARLGYVLEGDRGTTFCQVHLTLAAPDEWVVDQLAFPGEAETAPSLLAEAPESAPAGGQ